VLDGISAIGEPIDPTVTLIFGPYVKVEGGGECAGLALTVGAMLDHCSNYFYSRDI